MTIRPGVCSITFRSRPPEEVVDLAAGAALAGIEWGGDVHVPPRTPSGRVAELAERCRTAGLACPSYGSYLAAGRASATDIAVAFDTAVALGCANVRVWCPYGVGPDAVGPERSQVARGLEKMAATGAERGLAVSVEYHPRTLTETSASTLALLAEVGAPNVFTYWQPQPWLDPAALRREHEAVLSGLSHLHVFRWRDDGTRLPLALGADLWPSILRRTDGASGDAGGTRWMGERWAFLEFVAGDEPDQLRADASALRSWLEPAAASPSSSPHRLPS